MGAGHYPDLDEIRRAADKIETKHKDLRSAVSMRKLADECEQHRNGVPAVAPAQAENSWSKVLTEARDAQPHREG